jgi:hypothetical protein
MAKRSIARTHPLPLHRPLCGRSPSPSKLGEDFGCHDPPPSIATTTCPLAPAALVP